MLVRMTSRRLPRVEVSATSLALLALVGEWLSHTVEFVRVSGFEGAFGSVHAFMGPIGAVLVVAGLVGVHSTVRLVRRLERRLVELRRVERTGVPSRTLAPPPPCDPGTWSVLALVAIVWCSQCALYVLQENLEAGLSHHAPGLSVLAGTHALVSLVHLVVAMALVAGLWLTRRQVTRLVQAVRLVEARIWIARRAASAAPSYRAARIWTPLDRWGMQLWSRPPPAPKVA